MYNIIHIIINLIWSIPNRKTKRIIKIISMILIFLLYLIIITPLWIFYKIKILITQKNKNTYYKDNYNKFNKNSFYDELK